MIAGFLLTTSTKMLTLIYAVSDYLEFIVDGQIYQSKAAAIKYFFASIYVLIENGLIC